MKKVCYHLHGLPKCGCQGCHRELLSLNFLLSLFLSADWVRVHCGKGAFQPLIVLVKPSNYNPQLWLFSALTKKHIAVTPVKQTKYIYIYIDIYRGPAFVPFLACFESNVLDLFSLSPIKVQYTPTNPWSASTEIPNFLWTRRHGKEASTKGHRGCRFYNIRGSSPLASYCFTVLMVCDSFSNHVLKWYSPILSLVIVDGAAGSKLFGDTFHQVLRVQTLTKAKRRLPELQYTTRQLLPIPSHCGKLCRGWFGT